MLFILKEEDMEKSELERKLVEYVDSENIPFHMPGHKRNSAFSILNDIGRYDITEIDGFDNYHHPTDILKSEFDKASKIYGSMKSFYLVNGCTVGILAAVAAIFREGDKILMARNCHKSVYNAVYLNKLKPVYIYPDVDEKTGIYKAVDGNRIAMILKKEPAIKGIIITSPTYEGVVSDINIIANVAHEHRIPLIVDEAHGAHFHFSKNFPKDALEEGADVVVEGLHKTLPSLTQTAIMHVKSRFVDMKLLERYVSMYQTTSPSYLFMSSIGSSILCTNNSKDLIDEYCARLAILRKNLKDHLRHLRIFTENDDISKIVIITASTNITGSELAGKLKKSYHIETEMASLKSIVLMTSFCDDFGNYEVLYDALLKIDEQLETIEEISLPFCKTDNIIRMTPYQAMNEDVTCVDYSACTGLMAGEYVYVYPPGIPLIVPGEVFDTNVIRSMKEYELGGIEVIGLTKDHKVWVCRKEKYV